LHYNYIFLNILYIVRLGLLYIYIEAMASNLCTTKKKNCLWILAFIMCQEVGIKC